MTAAVALCWLVGSIVVVQTAFAVSFVVVMNRRRTSAHTPHHPKAVVILCLRGADPFLPDCVEGLLNQDYPDYEVHAVVDSAEDPSWGVLRGFQGHSRLKVSLLREPMDSCSLKCSGIVGAIRDLDPAVSVVALCDADVVPHPTWLADLAAPLASPEVGATTGNRWYMPQGAASVSMVRYLWNIPASINMILLGIAWGGSLAIRRSVIDEAGLLERWSEALCEDTMLFGVLRKHGYRQVFVPSVMMVNRESCTLRGLMAWVPRQLLTARLYHPRWPATVVYGIISSIVPFAAVAMVIWGWAVGDPEAVIMSAVAFGVFELANLLLVGVCEWAVRRRLGYRRAETGRPAIRSALWLPFLVMASQLISPLFFLTSFTMRRVEWRGVSYHIRKGNVRRGGYSAFKAEAPHRPPSRDHRRIGPDASR